MPYVEFSVGHSWMAGAAEGAGAGAGASVGASDSTATGTATGVSDVAIQRRTAEPKKAAETAVGAATSASTPTADLLAKRLRMVSSRPVPRAALLTASVPGLKRGSGGFVRST